MNINLRFLLHDCSTVCYMSLQCFRALFIASVLVGSNMLLTCPGIYAVEPVLKSTCVKRLHFQNTPKNIFSLYFTAVKRPPVFRDHIFGSLEQSLETGLTICSFTNCHMDWHKMSLQISDRSTPAQQQSVC